MLRHIVLMQIKPEVSKEDIDQLLADIGGLRGKIPGILGFAGGSDIMGGDRAQGYTHGFVMDFESEEALRNYLPHPEHKLVGDRVRAASDKILAFDIAGG